jgi:hypothetical protein
MRPGDGTDGLSGALAALRDEATARILALELDALVPYDDRLARAAADAGLVTTSLRDLHSG